MARGLFITFEGGDGAGKSTQVERLAARLMEQGLAVVLTREPGGTPGGERLRHLLLDKYAPDWSPVSEALLNYAARDLHLRNVIRPALAKGAAVISDRFHDSTRAYQGHAGGVDGAFLAALERAVIGETMPDLTFVLDIAPADAAARATARRGSAATDRFEARDRSFQDALRAAFLAIARAEPQRCKVIDAARDPDTVAADIWRHVEPALHSR
ncbi:MAG: dTMP kinase [Hyphomicrobiales bacterium]